MAKRTKFRHIIIDITGAQYTNALQSGRMYHRADTNLTFSHKQTHYYIPEESFLPNSMPLTLRFSRSHWEPTKSTVGSPPPLFPHYVTTNPWWLTHVPNLPRSPGTRARKVGLSSRSQLPALGTILTCPASRGRTRRQGHGLRSAPEHILHAFILTSAHYDIQ